MVNIASTGRYEVSWGQFTYVHSLHGEIITASQYQQQKTAMKINIESSPQVHI